MRSFVILCSIAMHIYALGQVHPLDKYTIDTIRLKEFKSKTVVAYKYNDVTFYVDYDDCKSHFSTLLQRYNEDLDDPGDVNPARMARRKLLGSTLAYLNSQIKLSDTAYLAQKTFLVHELDPLQDFLPDQLESGNCAIVDKDKKRHFIIIRHTGSWYRGPKEAWGGRRYFLPGHKTFFIEGMDWIS